MSDQSLAISTPAAEAPVRLLTRICNEYFLDTAAILADIFGGDVIKGLVWLTIIRANVEGLEHDSEAARLYSTIDKPPPNELRVPTTVYSVAKSLGLTYETGRRHVNWLIEKGYCVRTDEGLVITEEILRSPAFVRGNLRNLANYRKFMESLGRAGLRDFR
jgi:hypothetical protein